MWDWLDTGHKKNMSFHDPAVKSDSFQKSKNGIREPKFFLKRGLHGVG